MEYTRVFILRLCECVW